MEFSQFLTLTQANTERPVLINKHLLFGITWSDAHKSTLLISTNGGVIPVTESVKEVEALVKTTKPKGKS